MKTILKLSPILLIGLLLIACGETNEPSPYEEVNTLDGVELQLNQPVYESEGDTFLLTVVNNSEVEVTYGIAFTVEMLEDEQWVMVEPEEEMAFILIAHILPPGDEAEEELFMEYYEPFEQGTYRVVRQIEGEVLTAEFTVE
ncbi:MAG: hypothetical protein JJU16_12295 [Alkalibacterium sp.]|nr:hypothetical protein [Alkalibacterium sp.]